MSESKDYLKITKSVHRCIDIYLNQGLDDYTEEYRDIVRTIHDATENDSIHLHLASYGGSCSICTMVVNAITTCAAPVVGHVEAPCYSAGSTIALACNTLIMYPDTFLMFHNFSGGQVGKGYEMQLAEKATRKWIHGYFDRIHRPFLTVEECKLLESDRDVYVHASDKDIEKRMERHFNAKGIKRRFGKVIISGGE